MLSSSQSISAPQLYSMLTRSAGTSDQPSVNSLQSSLDKRKGLVSPRFQKRWHMDPMFSGWLSSVEGDASKARCVACDIVLAARHIALLRHSSAARHRQQLARCAVPLNGASRVEVGTSGGERPPHSPSSSRKQQSLESSAVQRVNNIHSDVTSPGDSTLTDSTQQSVRDNLTVSGRDRKRNKISVGSPVITTDSLELVCESVDTDMSVYQIGGALNGERYVRNCEALPLSEQKVRVGVSKRGEGVIRNRGREVLGGRETMQKILEETVRVRTGGSLHDDMSSPARKNTKVDINSNQKKYSNMKANQCSVKKLSTLKVSQSKPQTCKENNTELLTVQAGPESNGFAIHSGIVHVKREELSPHEETVEVNNEEQKTCSRKMRRNGLSAAKTWKDYVKCYRREWELDEQLSGWIAPVMGERCKAACKYCGCILRAHYADLKLHAATSKHKSNEYWYTAEHAQSPVILTPKECSEKSTVKHVSHKKLNKQQVTSSCYVVGANKSEAHPWFKYTKRYRTEWESLPQFAGWLSSVPGDDTRARCLYCGVLIRAHFNDLRNHARTTRHASNVTYGQPMQPIPDLSHPMTPALAPKLSPTSVHTLLTSGKVSNCIRPKTHKGLLRQHSLKTADTSGQTERMKIEDIDLYEEDSSLISVECLTNMLTMYSSTANRASNTTQPETTIILPQGSHLDASLSATLQSYVSAGTRLRVRKELPEGWEISGSSKRANRSSEAGVEDDITTVGGSAMQARLHQLTRSLTLWELLIMKTCKQHNSTTDSTMRIHSMLSEFDSLRVKLKEFCASSLQLLPTNDDSGSRIDNKPKTLVVSDVELASSLGLAVGPYQVLPDSCLATDGTPASAETAVSSCSNTSAAESSCTRTATTADTTATSSTAAPSNSIPVLNRTVAHHGRGARYQPHCMRGRRSVATTVGHASAAATANIDKIAGTIKLEDAITSVVSRAGTVRAADAVASVANISGVVRGAGNVMSVGDLNSTSIQTDISGLTSSVQSRREANRHLVICESGAASQSGEVIVTSELNEQQQQRLQEVRVTEDHTTLQGCRTAVEQSTAAADTLEISTCIELEDTGSENIVYISYDGNIDEEILSNLLYQYPNLLSS